MQTSTSTLEAYENVEGQLKEELGLWGMGGYGGGGCRVPEPLFAPYSLPNSADSVFFLLFYQPER